MATQQQELVASEVVQALGGPALSRWNLVPDEGGRLVADAEARLTQAQAEVDVLVVDEVAFVEASGRPKSARPNRHGAADHKVAVDGGSGRGLPQASEPPVEPAGPAEVEVGRVVVHDPRAHRARRRIA